MNWNSPSGRKAPYHFRVRPSNFGKNHLAHLRFLEKRTNPLAQFFKTGIVKGAKYPPVDSAVFDACMKELSKGALIHMFAEEGCHIEPSRPFIKFKDAKSLQRYNDCIAKGITPFPIEADGYIESIDKPITIPDDDFLWNEFCAKRTLYPDLNPDITFQKFKEIRHTLQKRY